MIDFLDKLGIFMQIFFFLHFEILHYKGWYGMLTLDRHCFNKLFIPTLDFCHSINSWKPPFLGTNFPLFGNTPVEQLLIFSDVTENSSFVIQTSAARTVYDAKFYIFYRSSLQDLQEGQHIIIVHGCCYYNSATAWCVPK